MVVGIELRLFYRPPVRRGPVVYFVPEGILFSQFLQAVARTGVSVLSVNFGVIDDNN
jgi:hypothetical protein